VGLALLEARAEAGDVTALKVLAHLSYYGIGVPVALAQAIEHFRRAADLGDAEARATLAELVRYAG
jgi:TPR repeat protein